MYWDEQNLKLNCIQNAWALLKERLRSSDTVKPNFQLSVMYRFILSFLSTFETHRLRFRLP